ncbi:MAG: GntR family transcriptional regulator [Rhodospirillales bacterium]
MSGKVASGRGRGSLGDYGPGGHATLSEEVYARLRLAIVSGHFTAGERMTIRGLAAELETSPTPIRDALFRLAAERAVEFAPNRYIRIPELKAAELLELRDMRTALEGLATERAVARLDQATAEALVAHDEAVRHLRDSADVKPVVEAIQRFHFTLYRASGMPALVQTIEGLWLRTAPYVNQLFPDYSQMERGTLRGMALKAILRRDAVSARRLMEVDIASALTFIVELAEAREAEEKAKP